jgi:hypothetical protein
VARASYRKFRGLSDGLAESLDLLIASGAAKTNGGDFPFLEATVDRTDGSKYVVRVTQTQGPKSKEDKVTMGLTKEQRGTLDEARAKSTRKKGKRKKQEA